MNHKKAFVPGVYLIRVAYHNRGRNCEIWRRVLSSFHHHHQPLLWGSGPEQKEAELASGGAFELQRLQMHALLNYQWKTVNQLEEYYHNNE